MSKNNVLWMFLFLCMRLGVFDLEDVFFLKMFLDVFPFGCFDPHTHKINDFHLSFSFEEQGKIRGHFLFSFFLFFFFFSFFFSLLNLILVFFRPFSFFFFYFFHCSHGKSLYLEILNVLSTTRLSPHHQNQKTKTKTKTKTLTTINKKKNNISYKLSSFPKPTERGGLPCVPLLEGRRCSAKHTKNFLFFFFCVVCLDFFFFFFWTVFSEERATFSLNFSSQTNFS